MADYLPPGACDKEIAAALAAKAALDRALSTYNDAANNVSSGMWFTGGGVLGMIGCGFTGPFAPICVAGAGAATIGGMYGTAGSAGGAKKARDALEAELDATEKAVAKACECVKANMVCVPD